MGDSAVTLTLQSSAAAVAGYLSSPFMQISNKCSLPGLKPRQILEMTAMKPLLGARWVAIRQSFSSIRGSTSIFVYRHYASDPKVKQLNLFQYLAGVCAGAGAETVMAGLPFEIPETRVQSGLSNYSLHCLKVIPFMFVRNVLTTVAPCYVVFEELNKELHNERSPGSNLADKANTKMHEEVPWHMLLFKTLYTSFVMASIASPVQGVVGRILQEQNPMEAIKNTMADFTWENRARTGLRVVSRATANSMTGLAITSGYLIGKQYFPIAKSDI